MPAEYKHHELAETFPMMPDAEYEALREDIAKHGLREPIYLFEGKILDGRNRYKAFLELRCDPKYRSLKLKTRTVRSLKKAEALSISENLQRRHLSKSQQAMVIVRSGLIKDREDPDGKRAYRTGGSSIGDIGEMFSVSRPLIYKAMYIHKKSKKWSDAVFEGRCSVAKAEGIIRAGNEEAQAGLCDSLGRKVPKKLQKLFQIPSSIESLRTQLRRMYKRLEALPPSVKPGASQMQKSIHASIDEFESIQPHSVCGKCSGKGCAECGKKGWLSTAEWKRASKSTS